MLKKIIDRASDLAHAAKFIIRKHVVGYSIDAEPGFDPEGREAFDSLISKAKTYVEFGSGGSTILASKYVQTLISVESDPVFSKTVRKALPASKATIHLLTPNLGATREWGWPVCARPTPARIERWKQYPKAPWRILAGQQPDLVLVDGRMRVACALETLLNVSPATTLLIDDYEGRDYSTVARFGELVAMHGRMAQFRKPPNLNEAACRAVLERYYAVLL